MPISARPMDTKAKSGQARGLLWSQHSDRGLSTSQTSSESRRVSIEPCLRAPVAAVEPYASWTPSTSMRLRGQRSRGRCDPSPIRPPACLVRRLCRVQSSLASCPAGPLSSRRPDKASAGQKRRTALARPSRTWARLPVYPSAARIL